MAERGEALHDIRSRIRCAPRPVRPLLELLLRHVFRLKYTMLHVVHRPVPLGDAPFPLQLRIVFRLRERREDRIARKIDLRADDHFHRAVKHTLVLLVPAEGKASLHENPVVVQPLHQRHVFFHAVHAFMYVFLRFLRDRLKPDQQSPAAAFAKDPDQFVVDPGRRSDKTEPDDLQRDQFGKQFNGILPVGHEIDIGKQYMPRIHGFDFCCHLFHRPLKHRAPERGRIRTETARMVTAADRFHGLCRDVTLCVQQLPPRKRLSLHCKITVLIVAFAVISRHIVVNKLRKCLLRKSGKDDIGVFRRLFRHERRMHSAHKHGYSLFTEIVRVGIAPRGRARDARDPDQIRIDLERDLSGRLIINDDIRFDICRNQCRQCRQRQRRIVERFSKIPGIPVHRPRRRK